MRAHDIGNLIRPLPDLPVVLAFEHDAKERFRARVANQQTSLTVEAILDLPDYISDRRDRRIVRAFAYAHVDQHLRVTHELTSKLVELFTGHRHDAKHIQR